MMIVAEPLSEISLSASKVSITVDIVPKAYDGIRAPRTFIYCRRYDDCSSLYTYFKHGLKEKFTYPTGAPALSKFRLVEMFCGCTDLEVKNQIITSFGSESQLRIATSEEGNLYVRLCADETYYFKHRQL